MDTLRELIEAARVSKSSAASVYHRDYVRTKDKPYRKYDPKKHKRATEEEEVSDDASDEEPVEEGAWDFIKGAAGHVGNQVKQAVGNTVRAGQQASLMGNITKSVNQLAQALATYDKLKGAQQGAAQQGAAQQGARPNPARQRNPQDQQTADPDRHPTPPPMNASREEEAEYMRQRAAYLERKYGKRTGDLTRQRADALAREAKPSDAVPAAFRATQKPRIRNGEFVFSSYLMDVDGEFISEGVWDFVKGAAGHVGGQVKQAVGNTVQAGQNASNAADYKQAVATAKQLIQQLGQMLQQAGNPKQVLQQVFSQSTLNPMIQQRIAKLILK